MFLAFVFASHCQWCWLLLLLLCLLHTYSCSPGVQTRCPGMWAKIADCGPDQRRRGGRKNCRTQHLILSAGLQWHSPVIELPLVIFMDSRGQVYTVFASRLLKKEWRILKIFCPNFFPLKKKSWNDRIGTFCLNLIVVGIRIVNDMIYSLMFFIIYDFCSSYLPWHTSPEK